MLTILSSPRKLIVSKLLVPSFSKIVIIILKSGYYDLTSSKGTVTIPVKRAHNIVVARHSCAIFRFHRLDEGVNNTGKTPAKMF